MGEPRAAGAPFPIKPTRPAESDVALSATRRVLLLPPRSSICPSLCRWTCVVVTSLVGFAVLSPLAGMLRRREPRATGAH